ncbi:uncharacterized protein [Watersipora subatra]|uniref:uncharacterized protein isoform X1 n=1 Tax=Watersipora subatra TaxID=2589382 RepID=UPI00355B34E9
MSTTTTTYKEMAVPAHLEGGRTINQYITSEDGSVKIPAMMVDADMFYEELKCYKLNMDDVLLRRFTKMLRTDDETRNGTSAIMFRKVLGNPKYVCPSYFYMESQKWDMIGQQVENIENMMLSRYFILVLNADEVPFGNKLLWVF